MSRRLTAKQVKELASFHKKANSKQRPTLSATVRNVGPEEAAKLWPGIVTHYTIKVRRPPKDNDTRE